MGTNLILIAQDPDLLLIFAELIFLCCWAS